MDYIKESDTFDEEETKVTNQEITKDIILKEFLATPQCKSNFVEQNETEMKPFESHPQVNNNPEE